MAPLPILVLEDEALIALDIESALVEEGFSVVTLSSCAAALEWLQVSRPAIVILDIGLRDGPCHEVVEILVAHSVPFVVHSGDIQSRYSDTLFRNGAWLGKPSHPEALLDIVKTATRPEHAADPVS